MSPKCCFCPYCKKGGILSAGDVDSIEEAKCHGCGHLVWVYPHQSEGRIVYSVYMDREGAENFRYNLQKPSAPDPTPTPPKKESILQEAERLVNGPRAQAYGPASESFGRIAKIASAMMTPDDINHIYEESELTPVFICKILVALKIGRQCNKHGRDNLVDLGGYSFLWNELEEALNEKN
jgi:hypothetical protein